MNVDSNKCIGCGTCVEDCFAKAISLIEGKAVHSEENVRAEDAVSVCPQHVVVSAMVADVDAA